MAKSPVCPHCNSPKVRRSHRRGIYERLMRWFLGLQPYRCLDCKKRFLTWSLDTGNLPWLGIVILVAVLGAAVFIISRPGDQPSGQPGAGQEQKAPLAEQAQTEVAKSKPSESGPEKKTETPSDTERMLTALEKAPSLPPAPPKAPPPRAAADAPPMRPGYAAVPALVGYPKSYAVWVLAKRKLKYKGLLHGPVKDKPNGQVFAQEPEPGAVVPQGTEVLVRSYVAPKGQKVAVKESVPNLKGLYQDAAEDALRRSGFVPRYRRVAVQDEAWHGLVAGQKPAAGTELAQGSSVEVSLFDAAKLRQMPFLIGLPLAYARWQLPRLGLPYKVVVHGPVAGKPHNQIFNQEPPPGVMVPQGLLVRLHVYQAPPQERKPTQAMVPEVRGFSYILAEDALRRLSLVPLYRLMPTPDPANYGLVVHQEPPAGSRLTAGKRVVLTVLGPQKERLGRGTTVPFLVGLPLSYAKWALTRRKLSMQEFLAGPAKGKRHLMVFMQNPAPGQPVPTGTKVKVKVYKAPEDEAARQMALVPDLTGLSREVAEDVVRRADLIPRFVYMPNPDHRWRGLAESQEPAAGHEALPGSEVLVRINK